MVLLSEDRVTIAPGDVRVIAASGQLAYLPAGVSRRTLPVSRSPRCGVRSLLVRVRREVMSI
jgi:hypothetical protein